MTKLITYLNGTPATNWSASGFLSHAISEGTPFMGQWSTLGGNPVADFLVMWGLTLTGFGFILGAFAWWNAFWAGASMVAPRLVCP